MYRCPNYLWYESQAWPHLASITLTYSQNLIEKNENNFLLLTNQKINIVIDFFLTK